VIALVFVALGLLVPPGFHEAKALEPAASYVAGKPVTVLCANTFRDWWKATSEQFGSGNYANGYTTPGASVIYLSAGFTCSLPTSAAAGKKVNVEAMATHVVTLVHEAIHARGEADEGVTECAAMHETPRVAVKFFHVKAGKQLRALMAAAWAVHNKKPTAYRAVC
jgi:hypothetical protein